MAYSRWRDSFWHTDSRSTHVDYIDAAQLFIHPKKGEHQTFSYQQLKALDLDTNWVAKTFPDAPQHMLMELLLFINAFTADMDRMFKWHGWKTYELYEAATLPR